MNKKIRKHTVLALMCVALLLGTGSAQGISMATPIEKSTAQTQVARPQQAIAASFDIDPIAVIMNEDNSGWTVSLAGLSTQLDAARISMLDDGVLDKEAGTVTYGVDSETEKMTFRYFDDNDSGEGVTISVPLKKFVALRYYAEDGTLLEQVNYPCGSKVDSLLTTHGEGAGRAFLGWSMDGELQEGSLLATTNMTLTECWGKSTIPAEKWEYAKEPVSRLAMQMSRLLLNFGHKNG